jgi:type I restriction enzyme M protein
MRYDLTAVMGMMVSRRCVAARNALWVLVCCLLGGCGVTKECSNGLRGSFAICPEAPSIPPCADPCGSCGGWETNTPLTMAKTTEQVTDVKQWMKLFEGSALYRHDSSRMFEDYLDLVLCCMANRQQEERYLQVAKRYTREELDTMAQLMAYHILIHEHHTAGGGWYDMLGDVYMELASRSKASRMGQFFTPVEVCEVMARITLPDADEMVGKSITDPAAGSGRMLLAAHAMQPKLGLIVAADLDPICAKMCALNFWLHGIRGEVACMDSLGLKWYFAYHTHPRYTWPFVTFLDESRKEESMLYRYGAKLMEQAMAAKKPAFSPGLFDQVEEPEEHYGELKAKYPDAVLMFRVPGSYVFLHADVETVGRVMHLTVGTSNALRIPESWYEEVMPALCKAGSRVAVCDESLAA